MADGLFAGGRQYLFSDEVRDDAGLRASFDALAGAVFGISFEGWHAAGGWGGRYRPLVLVHGGQVVASVGVSRLLFARRGEEVPLMQLGTVMTHPDHRHLGLAAYLMRRALAQSAGECVYLYANDDAAGFYPAFGFAPATETVHTRPGVAMGAAPARQMDMTDAADVALLRECFEAGSPFSAFSLRRPFGLVQFHCGGPLRQNIYHIETAGVVAIAGEENGELVLYDVYGPGRPALGEVLAALPGGQATVCAGFAPADAGGWRAAPLKEANTTLFTLGASPLKAGLRFPALSRA